MDLYFNPANLSGDLAEGVFKLLVGNIVGLTNADFKANRAQIEGTLPEEILRKWFISIQFSERVAIEPNADRKKELLGLVAKTSSEEEAAGAVAKYFNFNEREARAFLLSFKRVSYCLVSNQDVTLEDIPGDEQTILRGCLARVFGTAFLEESLTEIAVTLRQSVKEAQLAEEASVSNK